MSNTSILERIKSDGLTLSVSSDSNIEILGDENVIDSWLNAIRENKSTILSELQSQRILKELKNDNVKNYSIIVTDASTDPVLVEITISGLASFFLEIPQAHYDGLALLEVLEKYIIEEEEIV